MAEDATEKLSEVEKRLAAAEAKLADTVEKREKSQAQLLKEELKALRDNARLAEAERFRREANKTYASALLDASADVIKYKKELVELTGAQKHLNKQYSTVSNILAGVKNEFLKGLVGAQLEFKQRASTKTLLKKEEQILRARLAEAERLIGSRSNIENIQEQKKQNAERVAVIEQEISTKKALVDSLTTQLQQSSGIKSASDERFNKLDSINKQLQTELQKHQDVLAELDEKLESGKKLTKKEKDKRSQSIQKVDSLTDQLQKNIRSLEAEKTSRESIIQSHTDLESQLNSLNQEISSNEDQLKNVTSAMNDAESAISKLTQEHADAEEKAKKLGINTDALAEVMKDIKDKLGETVQEIKLLDFEGAASTVKKVENALTSLVSSIREFQQSLGISAADAVSIGFSNLKESIESYISAFLPAGESGAPVSFKEIRQAQIDFQNQFGEIIDPENARMLAQQAVQMGITTKQLADARRVFMTQTANDGKRAVLQVDKFIEEFRKKGLSSKVAFEAITNYSELIARNGTRFASSFSRAAVEAKKIGVDLNKVDQIGDNIINNFEGFLEKTAELGAMGFNLDFNTLAELAESGDTGALMGELRSQLALTGKDITKLRRSEQLALSETFGIPMSDLLRLAGKGGGSGEKTIEELTTESNGFLNNAVNFLSSLAGAAQFTNFLLSIIALNTSPLGKVSGVLGSLTRFLPGAAMIAAGGLGVSYGGSLVKQGNTGAGVGVGALGGGLMGAGAGALGLATLLAPVTGGSSLAAYAVLAGLGAVGGGLAAYLSGDDVVSKAGYGKRSLVTPNGIIALNNKDNIIAYADDFAGNMRLPYGSITDKLGGMFAEYGPLAASISDKNARNRFLKNTLPYLTNKATLGKAFPNATKGFDLTKSVSTMFGTTSKFSSLPTKYLMQNFQRLPFVGSLISGGLAGKEEYDNTGSMSRALLRGGLNVGGGIFGSTLGAFGGPVGAALGGMGGSNLGDGLFSLLTNPSAIKDKALGFASKIPGIGGLLSGGGLSSIGTNLLGKIGLGGLAGGPMTMVASMAAPLLKKIPVIGSTLANITQAPTKLLSSAFGKIGGLFGKKKKPAGGEEPSIAQSATDSLSMLSSIFGGADAQASAPALGSLMPDKLQGPSVLLSQLLKGNAQQQPQAQNFEQYLQKFMDAAQKNQENMIQAIRSQTINMYMDSLKVGKGVVASSESATQMGILAMEGRTR